jgi:hypothetical protein
VNELDAVLRAVSRELVVPPAPRVAEDVLARIASRRRARSHRLRVLALAAALLVVSTGTVLAAVPAARDAVLEVFHLGSGVTVERVETLPPIPRATTFRPGRPVTLEQARRFASFDVLVPRTLGAPDAVFVSVFLTEGEVNLVYRPRRGIAAAPETGVGVLVSEFLRGRFNDDIVTKLVNEAAKVERLRVDGHDALWITGPHFFMYRRGSGGGTGVRLAANVLVVERNDIYVRIESRLSRDETVRIAESLE